MAKEVFDGNHETQPEKVTAVQVHQVIHEDLLAQQIIEGGGPPKKADYSTLPKPLRVFGYVITGIVVLGAIIGVLLSILK